MLGQKEEQEQTSSYLGSSLDLYSAAASSQQLTLTLLLFPELNKKVKVFIPCAR